ncbi:MAG: hypothetical protein ACK4ND_13280 [Cytophagaceae bacterium]
MRGIIILFLSITLALSAQAGKTEINSGRSTLKLRMDNGSFYDETLIRFRQEATEGFDSKYDAYKMRNTGNFPNFYTHWNGIDYAINALPNSYTKFEIPLNFESTQLSTFELTVTETIVFPDEITIILLDHKTGLEHNLRTSNHINFDCSPTDNKERFTIVFTNTLLFVTEESPVEEENTEESASNNESGNKKESEEEVIEDENPIEEGNEHEESTLPENEEESALNGENTNEESDSTETNTDVVIENEESNDGENIEEYSSQEENKGTENITGLHFENQNANFHITMRDQKIECEVHESANNFACVLYDLRGNTIHPSFLSDRSASYDVSTYQNQVLVLMITNGDKTERKKLLIN